MSQPKRQVPFNTLEGHYQDFKGRFIQHRINLKLPHNDRKVVNLGLHPAFTSRIVANATRNRALGFVIQVNEKGAFGTMAEQIPGKIKHMVDSHHFKTPQKKLEAVQKLQIDLERIRKNLKRQRTFIKKRMQIKPNSSEELISAKKSFGQSSDIAIKGLDMRLGFAANALWELEQKYLSEKKALVK